MLRPTVCAVEAYERFSFERSVSAQPGNAEDRQHSSRQESSCRERKSRLTIDGDICRNDLCQLGGEGSIEVEEDVP